MIWLTRAAYDLIDRHRVYTDISEATFGALLMAGIVSAGDDDALPTSNSRVYRDMALSVLRQLPAIDYDAVTNRSVLMPTVDIRANHAWSRIPMVLSAFFIGARRLAASLADARRCHLCRLRLACHDGHGRRPVGSAAAGHAGPGVAAARSGPSSRDVAGRVARCSGVDRLERSARRYPCACALLHE